jgi:uncharacterized membrane protein
MELDELKSAWAQYDKKLSRSLELNEVILKKMNLKDSKNEIQKTTLYELSNVVLMALWVVIVGFFSFRIIDKPQFSVPGFFSAAIACVYVAFAVVKLMRFLSIDHYGSSILQLQQDVEGANELMLRLRKYELLLIPFILTPILPLLFKVVHHVDVYDNPRTFLISLILILVFAFPSTFLVNKYMYDRRFQNSQRLLKMIEEYKLDK